MSNEEQHQLNSMLFEACRTNNIEEAKEAIEAGTDIEAKNKYGWAAIDYCKTRKIKALISSAINKKVN